MTWGGPLAVVGRPLRSASPRTTSTSERVVVGLTVLSRVGWRCVGPLAGPLIPAWSRRLTTWCVPFLVESLRAVFGGLKEGMLPHEVLKTTMKTMYTFLLIFPRGAGARTQYYGGG